MTCLTPAFAASAARAGMLRHQQAIWATLTERDVDGRFSTSGVSHRVPWKQDVLGLAKLLF